MKKFLLFIKSKSLKLARQFENRQHVNEPGFFGLGQFVLLLAIAPFIFNMELYSIGKIEPVPSLYEYDVNRFPTLPVYPELGKAPKAPPKAKPLNKQEKALRENCGKVYALFYPKSLCVALNKKQAKYIKTKAYYDKHYPIYLDEQAAYEEKIKQRRNASAAYENFRPELSSKPQPLPPIDVIQTANRSFTAMLGSSLALDDWRDTGTIIWLLAALLIIPALWLAVRKRCWSLLLCGLLIPAYNYLVSVFSLLPNLQMLSGWQITSSLVAQVAFVWFAIKGHIFSRSFTMFILALSISVSWAAILDKQAYSVLQAQLPIIVFIVAAIIARLVVKGVQENAYLFVGKGLQHNLFKAGHALLLWIPMGLLALPLLYLSGVTFPKTVVNTLHKDQVLLYDYDHDVLDNALQSTAAKTDDAIFAWHLSTQNTLRDIYLQGKNLLNNDLQKRVEVTFDQVMPANLEFVRHESDKVIIGEGIELAVDAAQDSTNAAFKRMRAQMKAQVSFIAGQYEAEFKRALNKSIPEALKVVNKVHLKGQDALLEANRKAQNSLWWSINYSRAVHTLTILLFVFVCLKSFLYVFARVSFNRDSGTFVTLGSLEEHISGFASRINATGLSYNINPDHEATYYISRRYQVRGKAPNYRIPQAIRAPFARLFNGAYSMNKVELQVGDDEVQCTATKGMEFFEWDLRADEVVFFDFHNFVGMSDSIELSTHISTRASSLLLGKMIYSQAKGPGKLILMSEGRAEITDSEFGGGSLPPERIIATQKNTRFHIDSEIDPVNIYLSSAYVRPAGGGQVIVDVDSQRGTKTGLGSFIKRFILPI